MANTTALFILANREVSLAKLNRKAIKRINSLRLDNVARGGITVRNWKAYELY